jgi:hypothetical protein
MQVQREQVSCRPVVCPSVLPVAWELASLKSALGCPELCCVGVCSLFDLFELNTLTREKNPASHCGVSGKG